jgi:relaxase-like protein
VPKQMVRVPRTSQAPELDIVSYGRHGRHTPLPFNSQQLEQIARTVRKTPEVILKVSGGGKTTAAARAHFQYIDRHGKLEIETDEGRRLRGKGAAQHIVEDWNLELGHGQYRPAPKEGERDSRPKQVHNIVLSMPKGTPADKLLAASKKFAREKFAFTHRYAMVLHTDQEHPHVHLVVKAESEQGERLYIRKATLRTWREDFAAYLRELGVAANATPAPMRGSGLNHKKVGIYRAMQRGASTHVLQRETVVREELKRGTFTAGAARQTILQTRKAVVSGWEEIGAKLRAERQESLAQEVEAFIRAMARPMTEKQQIAQRVIAAEIKARQYIAHNREFRHDIPTPLR